MRTRFLRTTEFLSGGHTRHPTREKAERETLTISQMFEVREEFPGDSVIVDAKARGAISGRDRDLHYQSDGDARCNAGTRTSSANFSKSFETPLLSPKPELAVFVHEFGGSTRCSAQSDAHATQDCACRPRRSTQA